MGAPAGTGVLGKSNVATLTDMASMGFPLVLVLCTCGALLPLAVFAQLTGHQPTCACKPASFPCQTLGRTWSAVVQRCTPGSGDHGTTVRVHRPCGLASVSSTELVRMCGWYVPTVYGLLPSL